MDTYLTEVSSNEQQRELLQQALTAVATLAQDSLNRLPAESRREVERRMHAGEALTVGFRLQGGTVVVTCDLDKTALFEIQTPAPAEAKRAATMH